MSSDSTGTAPVHTEVHPVPPKGLVLLVKTMAVVLVVLFLGLIFGIIWKAQTAKPAPALDVIELGIDPANIRLMTLDGNNLALTTDKEILVFDLKQRKVILRNAAPR